MAQTDKILTHQITVGDFTLNYYERPDDNNHFELFHGDCLRGSLVFHEAPDQIFKGLTAMADWAKGLPGEIKQWHELNPAK
jgi:hypothetical protein